MKLSYRPLIDTRQPQPEFTFDIVKWMLHSAARDKTLINAN
jgi:hypothetical protein